VPTACRQARKQDAFGSPVIKVEGLRIELTGKCFDLLLINDVGSARKALPDVEIIEIPTVVAEFRVLKFHRASAIFRAIATSQSLLL
jgi:hypothetical protein